LQTRVENLKHMNVGDSSSLHHSIQDFARIWMDERIKCMHVMTYLHSFFKFETIVCKRLKIEPNEFSKIYRALKNIKIHQLHKF